MWVLRRERLSRPAGFLRLRSVALPKPVSTFFASLMLRVRIGVPMSEQVSCGISRFSREFTRLLQKFGSPRYSSSLFKSMPVMQQLISNGLVGTESEGEPALRPGESSRPLDELMAHRVKPLELPEGRALGGRAASWLASCHLQFPVEIVGQRGGEQEDLVPGERLRGDVVELPVGFQFSEASLLGASAVVIADHLFGANRLVGYEDLELVAALLGNKEVELDRSFVPHCGEAADEEEAITAAPRPWLPALLEVSGPRAQPTPEAMLLDPAFQLDKALKRHGDGEFNAQLGEQGDQGVAEKGAVHADLNLNARQGFAKVVDASEDEVLGTVGIVNVTRSVVDIEDLTGLRYRAEQRIVAALALLVAIEPDGGALGIAAGGDHRAVEIHRQATQTESGQPLSNELPAQLPQSRHSLEIGRGQQTTDGGHIRQALQAQHSLHHGIIAVVPQITELAKAQQQVNDETERSHGVVVSAIGAQVAEGDAQPLLEIQSLKEELKQKQAGKGSQLLVFEQQVRSGVGFAPNLFSAKLHVERSPWVGDGVLTTPSYQSWDRFFHKSSRFLDLTDGAVQRHGPDVDQTPTDRPLTAFDRDSLCNWRVTSPSSPGVGGAEGAGEEGWGDEGREFPPFPPQF